MIKDTAIHQESDADVDDDGDQTAQPVLVANRAPSGASLAWLPLLSLSGNKYRGWGAIPGPGLLTGVRVVEDGRAVG